MKTIGYCTLILFLSLNSLTACKKEINHTTKSDTTKNTIDGKWSLMRIYGGISGANEVHAINEITWTFNTQTATLTVNNNTGNSTYYYLPSGTYPFQQVAGSTENYLVIDANELGQMTFSGNQLLIDENKKSTGEGACGFYLTLQR
ncbi:hypothetical protein [Fluviicola chungangensis]|uniref:Lipocalin-like domain-containing protein n=1 Tax=Fluviicola chungangensis TaxID=2597671 RepID=A0A556MGL9_9FLAO|nr:hypothetical protein [Fluviicola chungangensis]TSJ39036.1 hypothetical protein FO442_17830 [Fluviicola chungangensis]